MKIFFFLSFAFTNGNVFWSQGFYNWENLQLIQYISRFHNFTISDVKSKKKQTTTHKQIDKIPQIVSKYLTAFITLSLKSYKISSIPRQSNERSLFRRSLKTPLNFALNCAKQPLHCSVVMYFEVRVFIIGKIYNWFNIFHDFTISPSQKSAAKPNPKLCLVHFKWNQITCKLTFLFKTSSTLSVYPLNRINFS